MNVVLSGLNLDICLVYLDDIVVFSDTIEQHFERLATVFERLRGAGLKLKPEKCRFLQRSVRFLGHVISQRGIVTDPEKTKAVSEWPVPTSFTEVRAFVGLTGYYRRFVRDFAKIAAPLHALTAKGNRFRWTVEAQRAFDELKQALTSPPILAMPRDDGDFILDTDAADGCIDAVLSQCQEGVEKVIAFASRSLDKREINYCITRKELLAIVHFLKYFRVIVSFGANVYCENRSRSTHLATSHARPNKTAAIWLETMEGFSFTVEHRPGAKHGNTDALSRRPCPKKECACRQPDARLLGRPADQSVLIAGVQVESSNPRDEGGVANGSQAHEESTTVVTSRDR